MTMPLASRYQVPESLPALAQQAVDAVAWQWAAGLAVLDMGQSCEAGAQKLRKSS
jgi:hypothetical protein